MENSDEYKRSKGLVIPQCELDWLEAELEIHKKENIIVVSHIPIYYNRFYPVSTLPDGTICKVKKTESTEFTKLIDNPGNLSQLRLLTDSCNNIKLFLAGHWHMNDRYTKTNSAYCQTCSLSEYPFEFKVIEPKESSLSVVTSGLMSSELNNESIIPERHNTWVTGKHKDRIFKLIF